MIQTEPILQVVNLSYRYPDGSLALDGVSLSIYPGEKIGLVGPNGAGKSTLLLHLNGSLLSRKSLMIHGDPVTPSNRTLARSTVGLVFQQPDDMLFNLSVREEVAFGPQRMALHGDEAQQRTDDAIWKMRLEGYEDRPPFHLSLGEKKRVALASVLAMQPEIYAIDEPFSGLDPAGRREMLELLRELPGSLVVATHDLDAAGQLCDRLLLLDQGCVAAIGESKGILADENFLRDHRLL